MDAGVCLISNISDDLAGLSFICNRISQGQCSVMSILDDPLVVSGYCDGNKIIQELYFLFLTPV